MKKYRLDENDTITHFGSKLYRIIALRDFGNVKTGDRGGYVRNEANLSHNGDCWIYDDAKVYDCAKVFGNALVFGKAKVSDCVKIAGDTEIYGVAKVSQ